MWWSCWGFQTSAQSLPFLCSVSRRARLKEKETAGTTEEDDRAVPSEGCAAHGSAVLKMGIA